MWKNLQKCKDVFRGVKKNVEITYGNRNFLVHHNKYIIVDKSAAFVMTANLDDHLNKSTDFIVCSKSKDICENILAIFDYDWNNRLAEAIDQKYIFNKSGLYWSNGSVDKIDMLYKQYYVNDLENDRHFVNNGSSLAAYKNIVENAKESINIYMQLVNSFDCLKILCDAAERGVKIRVIFQSLGNHRLDTFIQSMLYRAGIEVMYNYEQLPYVHAKVIIVDEKLAIIGSMNFSYPSTNLNRELVIGIHGEKVKILLDKFNTDFKQLKLHTDQARYSFHHPYTQVSVNQTL